MALLVEYFPFQLREDLILEGKDNRGPLIVKGVAQRAEVKNQNGRVYPKALLEREVEKYQTVIDENRAFGELDHPDRSVVEFKNTSHVIRKLWWEGNDLWSEIQILPTPSGQILETILKAGLTTGISSRGVGSVKELYEEDSLEVQDDFELICWDFVTNPSTHGSFQRLKEGAELDSYKYKKVNNLVTDLICTLSGICPV